MRTSAILRLAGKGNIRSSLGLKSTLGVSLHRFIDDDEQHPSNVVSTAPVGVLTICMSEYDKLSNMKLLLTLLGVGLDIQPPLRSNAFRPVCISKLVSVPFDRQPTDWDWTQNAC